jgi:prepilin-type N-terminal cleavage/methylation domain-containing protein
MRQRIPRMLRLSFTLLELLVVIAIIAVLISLITAAAVRVMVRVQEVETRSEIDQLAMAIQNFQTKYGVNHVPSRIVLREDGKYDMNERVQADSYAYLTRLWPRLSVAFGVTFPIDWNGNGIVDPPVELTGDQCLVFFLGGIQNSSPTPHCLGFSTNEKNPAQLTGARIGPFYEFKSSQLILIPWRINVETEVLPLLVGSNGYYSYLDPYGSQPYAYYSSYGIRNGYNRYYAFGWAPGGGPGSSPGGVDGDCTTLYGDPWPYCDRPFQDGYTNLPVPDVEYYNPTTFQIVSAGRDQQFGPGGAPGAPTQPGYFWVPGMPLPPTLLSLERDNITNFYDRLLGD